MGCTTILKTIYAGGDAIAELLYERLFLSEDALNLSSEEVLLVEYEKDAEMQYAGIDLVVHPATEQEALVEIKAAVDYAGLSLKTGKPLGTFAHELSYLNAEGHPKPGWLVNNCKQSSVYVYCWIPEVREGLLREPKASFFRIGDVEDITALEVAMVTRGKLRSYLASKLPGDISGNGWEEISSWLLSESERMRGEGISSSKIGRCRATLSLQLREQPVNLLIPKADLREISFHSYRLSRTVHSDEPSRIDWAVVNWDS